MRIAIASSGPKLESRLAQHFARAPYFVIFDTDSGGFHAFKNPGVTGASGAGIRAASTAIGVGAQAVITQHCGPNAQEKLRRAGVSLYTQIEGTVAQALRQLERGAIRPVQAANVQAHFGLADPHKRHGYKPADPQL